MQAEKGQDQFKSFYGMTRFAVNNASSQVVSSQFTVYNYVIFGIL